MKGIKLIERAKNAAGIRYGLGKDEKGTFSVWVLKTSYSGHIKDGISYAWCYCIKDVDESTARAVFAKKLKSKAR